MSALVDAVRARTPSPCRATRCRKEGVSASLEGLSTQRVLVDIDCDALNIPPQMQRCDFILAYGEDQLVPIELKKGDVELAKVAAQLTGGGRIADQRLLSNDLPQVHFRPVVVYSGKFNRRRRKKTHTLEQVEFRGRSYEIKAIRSGSPLAKALG